MQLDTQQAIREFLEQYDYFIEAIISEVMLSRYQTEMDMVLETSVATPIPAQREQAIRLHFQQVQALLIENALNDSQLSEPEAMNWGMNEISIIHFDGQEHHYGTHPAPFYTMIFVWEDQRKIEIRFASLTVSTN